MRARLLVPLLLLPLAAAAQAAPGGDSKAVTRFVIEGRGWGHGVGMSQWGAEGFAGHGWTFDRILAHYYPGTTPARVAGVRVRVLLAEGRGAVRISSKAPLRLIGAGGRVVLLKRGAHRFPAALQGVALPARVEPTLRPLALDGAGYQGALVLLRGAGGLTVVNDLPLERYLRGVVPWEVPYDWRVPALEAQAVAARSYAVAGLRSDRPYDVVATTADQVYGGIQAERPSTNRAIGRTAGIVLRWHGRVARTYYFSTSGGRTASAADVFGRPIGYLRSVPDPYDGISPHHRWGPFAFTAAGLARKLGLRAVRKVVPIADSSGRVAAVRVLGLHGIRRIDGRDFAHALGLRSTWFTVNGNGPTLATPRWRPPPGLVGWPAGKSGYTVVLAAVPASAGPAAAKAAAKQALKARLPQVGMLVSADFPNLAPGYTVVFSGVYGGAGPAESARAAAARAFPAAYVRQILPR